MSNKFIDTQQLLEVLAISPATLNRYKKRGMIPYIKLGNVHRYDLEKVIRALEYNPIKIR
ncbi:helix-turn-helix domain-containing protein [Sphingobacterium daejeonense]|uniref:helix-turn-helix domain-containing protein n=1 Tax=Sphingobacterium daejeonense TaxID=371142 RepID=UPI0021A31215|nr:helix-turn-helix domain-containing protein [Sphingobacterium daejeonense]MCT1529960.1 helix-turn-helix domain-containing protein [Sphingobacterium daejeonense]